MTLIAIATHDDRAEIVTDSLASTPNGRYAWSLSNSKESPVGDLPAVSVSTGQSGTGLRWDLHLAALARQGHTVDELVGAADAAVCCTAQEETVLYLIGWSDRHATFTAHAWAPWTDFQPVDVSGVHLSPHPEGVRPGDDMQHRYQRWATAQGRASNGWFVATGPDRVHPVTVTDWRDLVQRIRNSRSARNDRGLDLYNMLGGTIRRTTLTRTDRTLQTIGVLDDPAGAPSAQFRRMVMFTENPITQRGPCFCGSGIPRTHCHLDTMFAGKRCTCGSERLFEHCCRVGVDPNEDHLLDGLAVLSADGTPCTILRHSRSGRTQWCASCGGDDVDQQFAASPNGRLSATGTCRTCSTRWAPPPVPARPGKPFVLSIRQATG